MNGLRLSSLALVLGGGRACSGWLRSHSATSDQRYFLYLPDPVG